jgi:histidinol phosphatase-like PHP family hydrolase
MGQPPMIQREFLTLAAAKKVLKRKPDWRENLKGDLQMHTVWSDGSGTVEEMARAAIGLDYSYIGITDHTKWLQIAGGLDEVRLAQQGREISKLNSKLKGERITFTVLRSAEVNLSAIGDVDMDVKSLAALDVVLGSFHSALRRTEDQTFRYVSAIRNPNIQILGHPQCRVYNYRLGLNADWARVFAEAAKLDKAVEIDGYADRQDLKVSLLKIARKEGTRISLGTDAHHPWQLAFMDLSLAAAIQAKIPQDRIINFMPLEDLRKWVLRVRSGQKVRRPKSKA